MKAVRITCGADMTVLADKAHVADGVWSRFRGLMLQRSLKPGEGLLLRPCSSVHTAFMRFPIDVIFLDRDGVVVRQIVNLRPFRVALGGRGAYQALELPAGAAQKPGVSAGDRLDITPAT